MHPSHGIHKNVAIHLSPFISPPLGASTVELVHLVSSLGKGNIHKNVTIVVANLSPKMGLQPYHGRLVLGGVGGTGTLSRRIVVVVAPCQEGSAELLDSKSSSKHFFREDMLLIL
jgi:hypothetical protein